MKKSSLLGAVCACLLTVVSMSAHAALVFSQEVNTAVFGLSSNIDFSVADDTQHPAESFILGADTTISLVGWFGGYSSVDTLAHDFRIRFYEDDSGLPLTTSFFEQTVNLAGTSTGLINATSSILEYSTSISPLVLLGGTQYWVEILEADSTTNTDWNIAESTPDASGLTRRYSDSGTWSNTFGVFANSRGSLALNLSGEIATVPVPAAVWLFGSGLLGLVGMARRKGA